MSPPGFRSLFAPWVGGATVAPAVSHGPLPPPSGPVSQDLDLLARMLRRLPASLWDIDPAAPTLQRDLYHAMAVQLAILLENRDIARTMTLLREAAGVDLDTLLADYGLKRYLQRPDASARQIGQQLLFAPRGTHYAIERLADLLFDGPHVTLRTGRSQEHVFVALTHPVTTPYNYWGLISTEGLWYAVTVDGTVPTISLAPPPGLNVAPGPHTLAWFTVQDDLGADWYVTIAGDTLQITQALPAGYGTTVPFSTLDGHGQRWSLAVRAADSVLVSIAEPAVSVFGTWQVRARDGTLLWLWIEAEVPTVADAPPGGSTDETPSGGPFDWLLALDATGTLWYVQVDHDTLVTTRTAPGGTGPTVPVTLFDAAGQHWLLATQAGTEALVTTRIRNANDDLLVVAPAAPLQTFHLVDATGGVWWLFMAIGTLLLQPTLPTGAVDVTPAGGPYRWWRLYDLAGVRYYAAPDTAGSLIITTTAPGGMGTAVPQFLGDRDGVLWHIGIDGEGDLAVSNAPPVDYAGAVTAVCLRDATGARWFWRVQGAVLEWAAFLWPDTVDQSPWGDLGWLAVLNEDGALRYVAPTPRGDPYATAGPPSAAPWGWQEPIRLRDHAGTWWHLTVLDDDRIGIAADPPDDVPFPTDALPLREALEAFAHVQAAGTSLTLLVT